jgi:glucokinase
MSAAPVILVGDVGGTNARFAIADATTLRMQHTGYRRTADFAGLHEAIASYLADEAQGIRPTHAAIAVASPVGDDRIKLTNNHWQFSVSELQRQLGLQELRLLNDFTVQALAVPHLDTEDFTRIGPDVTPRKGAAMAVLGPGTGLGVSGLVADGRGGYAPLSGEGGHVGIAPETDEEFAILRYAQEHFGRVSIERLICGSGIAFLYRALCHVRGETAWPHDEARIVTEALQGDALCRDTINQFCALLGSFAGDMALILGARGGVYIAGGVVPRFGALFAQSPFRERFENKGRFSTFNAAIPTYVVNPHENPALLGAASVFQQKG